MPIAASEAERVERFLTSFNAIEHYLRLHVPAALLDWLCVCFGLESSLEAGAIVEIPRARAQRFALAGSLPPGSGLVQVKVTSPGWKRRGKTVGKASGEVICAHARGDYRDTRNP